MVETRLVQLPAFTVAGEKRWISGQDNDQFRRFWEESHANGLIDRLRSMSDGTGVTHAYLLGVSCVDRDPDCRAFDFLIASEVTGEVPINLTSRVIPACLWAVFSNHGEQPMHTLVEAEMYAFTQWLPASSYRHAYAPELEVYPTGDQHAVEFWLPVEPKA